MVRTEQITGYPRFSTLLPPPPPPKSPSYRLLSMKSGVLRCNGLHHGLTMASSELIDVPCTKNEQCFRLQTKGHHGSFRLDIATLTA